MMTIPVSIAVRRFALVIAASFAVANVGQAQVVTTMGGEKMDGPGHALMKDWKEMNAFHSVLSRSWHPAQDGGDLKPFKMLADSLALRGKQLSSSSIPRGCDAPRMRQTLGRMFVDSRTLAELAEKDESDQVLLKKLGALHEMFEHAGEACAPAKK